MQDEVLLTDPGHRVANVPLLAGERHGPRKRLGKCGPELTTGPGDQSAGESLAERIGVSVLHRCSTRVSFHGSVLSSGLAASYSRVTW